MTLFMATVSGPDEADIALAHGADVIDLQAPATAFGAVGLDVVQATSARLAGRRPLSVAAGDLPMDPDAVTVLVSALADTGADYIRVGLSPGPKLDACIGALAPLARQTKLVGVMFADNGADNGLLPKMAEAGFHGAMLDTAGKGAGLLDRVGLDGLLDFIDACRGHNLTSGLAGRLEAPDIPRLLLLKPDVLGFRRRLSPLDAEAVGLMRGLIPLDPGCAIRGDASAEKTDDGRRVAGGNRTGSSNEEPATDRVLVRDFTLPVRIGAYARELDHPQIVRFNVDVDVLRLGHAVEDMRDVFSYDIITDGIRMIAGREHVTMVETLAERVASLVLAFPRAVRVTVRVEKLIGSGAVGVEITRNQLAEPSSPKSQRR